MAALETSLAQAKNGDTEQRSVQSSGGSTDVSTELSDANEIPGEDEDPNIIPWDQAFSPASDDQLKADARTVAEELSLIPVGTVSHMETDAMAEEIIRTIRQRASRLRGAIGMRADGSVRVRTVLERTNNQAQIINLRGFENVHDFVSTLGLTFEQREQRAPADSQEDTRTKTCPIEMPWQSYISGFAGADMDWRSEVLCCLRMKRMPEGIIDVYNGTMLNYMTTTAPERESMLRTDLDVPADHLLHLHVETKIKPTYSEEHDAHLTGTPPSAFSMTLLYSGYHKGVGQDWEELSGPWECQMTVRRDSIVHCVVGPSSRYHASLPSPSTSDRYDQALVS